MASENYMYIAQFFYVIQNIARVYFYVSTLELKNNDRKHKLFILACISILNLSFTYLVFDNFFLKIGVDVVFTTMLFKFMSIEKLSKILVYVMLMLNLEIIFEIVVSFSVVAFIGPKVFYSDSYVFNILLQIYFTFVFSIIMISATHVVRKKKLRVSLGLAVLIVCLTILQSSVMLFICYGIYSKITAERLILPIIGIIISYVLMKVMMKRIYVEYKYKKNVAYFVEQYEESLKKYIELKEHDEEISYLRHEILNQLDTIDTYNMKY